MLMLALGCVIRVHATVEIEPTRVVGWLNVIMMGCCIPRSGSLHAECSRRCARTCDMSTH